MTTTKQPTILRTLKGLLIGASIFILTAYVTTKFLDVYPDIKQAIVDAWEESN